MSSTGNQLCSLDINPDEVKNSCVGVAGVNINSFGNAGLNESRNKGCDQAIERAWPWGLSIPNSSTNNKEWSYGDTHIVCCI